MDISFYLPFPPTVNNYYVKTQRGVFISHKGRKFRDEAMDEIHAQLDGLDIITTPMLVEVVLFVPDKRVRDLDNYMKGLLDSITQANVWTDDSLIDQLFVYRGEICKNGRALVKIYDAAPVIPVGEEPG